jgi:hypothetical protein
MRDVRIGRAKSDESGKRVSSIERDAPSMTIKNTSDGAR